jgi:hypothetical protein
MENMRQRKSKECEIVSGLQVCEGFSKKTLIWLTPTGQATGVP